MGFPDQSTLVWKRGSPIGRLTVQHRLCVCVCSEARVVMTLVVMSVRCLLPRVGWMWWRTALQKSKCIQSRLHPLARKSWNLSLSHSVRSAAHSHPYLCTDQLQPIRAHAHTHARTHQRVLRHTPCARCGGSCSCLFFFFFKDVCGIFKHQTCFPFFFSFFVCV